MFAKCFAMVGGHDRQRAVANVETRQRVIEPSHQLVGPGDFAVVRAIRILRRVRLGRFIWRVRIVEMDPCERAIGGVPLQPCDGLSGGNVAAPLEDVKEIDFLAAVGARLDAIGEVVEPAAETRLRRQHDRRDESGRLEPGRLECLGQRRDIRRERA